MARGSIERRGESWSGRVLLPPDPLTGKRRQRRITAATKREVERQMAALLVATEHGFVDAGKKPVREFLEGWLETIAPTVRPSTLRRYRDVIRKHIIPIIGHLALAKLTAGDVQRLYADRLTILSPAGVRHLHCILHHALDDAVKWGSILRNPSDAVDPPRKRRTEFTVWNASEVAQVLNAATDDPLEPLWRLALLTGMRRGELLGLKWSDTDFESSTLSVNRSLSRGETSRLVEGEPKTERGRRRVMLPESAIQSLRAQKDRQEFEKRQAGTAYDDRGYVFANPIGDPLHVNALMLRFGALIERAGVKRIRFHDLRHTSATMLLAAGVHPKIVQERLGHSNIAMTLDLYSHVSPDMQRQAADALELMVSRTG